jgi:hypothetical protein
MVTKQTPTVGNDLHFFLEDHRAWNSSPSSYFSKKLVKQRCHGKYNSEVTVTNKSSPHSSPRATNLTAINKATKQVKLQWRYGWEDFNSDGSSYEDVTVDIQNEMEEKIAEGPKRCDDMSTSNPLDQMQDMMKQSQALPDLRRKSDLSS